MSKPEDEEESAERRWSWWWGQRVYGMQCREGGGERRCRHYV